MNGLLLTAILMGAPAGEIQHRFLAVDESRHQVVYVDQFDATKNWTIVLPVKRRDVQLIGQGRLLVGGADGYREYRLSDQKLLKEVTGFPGAAAARRQADGRTILACNQEGVTVYELGADDKPLRMANFKNIPSTRLVRMTPQGTFLFGSLNQVYEGSFQGQILKSISLPKGAWAYQALRRTDGHLLVAGGYLPCFYEFDADGKLLRTLGGKDSPDAAALGLKFFAGFQILPTGNLVISNWTGHGANDSQKGTQLVEYSPQGQVLWKWHAPQRAGSIDGVIVVDGLDLSQLHDDVSGVLGPVTPHR
jgi:hypothetical protein